MATELIEHQFRDIYTIKLPQLTVYLMNSFQFKHVFKGIQQRILSHRNQSKIWREHKFLIVHQTQNLQPIPLLPNMIEMSHNDELSLEAISTILSRSDCDEFVISMQVDTEHQLLYLLRGNLEPLLIPFEAFTTTATGQTPDFNNAEIIDYGRTLRLGDYEAGVDSLLYDYDIAYRKGLNKLRAQNETTLGACLRRARLSLKLRQSDFPGLSTKEIGRIERGEIKRPHAQTLRIILDTLNISSKSELMSY